MPGTHLNRGAGPFALEAADLGHLREVLAGHGFLGDGVREAVGARIGADHLRRDLPLYLRRQIVRAFHLVDAHRLDQSLPLEQVSLNFSKVSLEFRDAAGGGSKVEVCDFRGGKDFERFEGSERLER